MSGTQALPAVLLAAAVVNPFGGAAFRLTEQGNRQYTDGALDEALGSYTTAQEHAPDAPELLYDIGNVLQRRGEHAAAVDAYERALASAPSSNLEADVAHNLGNAHFRQQEFDAAADAYRRALRLDPQADGTKRNLELALRALERQQQQQQQQQGQDGEQDDDGDEQQEQQQQQEPGQEQEQQDSNDRSQPDEPGEQAQPQPAGQPEPSETDQAESSAGDPQPGEQEADGLMSREQAERLLDGLAEDELGTLREELRRNAPRGARQTEEDW